MRVGQMIYGYCRGMFGRDHYGTWRIETLGYDWVVLRYVTGGYSGDNTIEFMSSPGERIEETFEAEDFVKDED